MPASSIANIFQNFLKASPYVHCIIYTNSLSEQSFCQSTNLSLRHGSVVSLAQGQQCLLGAMILGCRASVACIDETFTLLSQHFLDYLSTPNCECFNLEKILFFVVRQFQPKTEFLSFQETRARLLNLVVFLGGCLSKNIGIPYFVPNFRSFAYLEDTV